MKPWKKVEETVVYNGYRKIINKTFILPNGRKQSFDIISTKNAVAILALTESNKVILARQFRPGTEEIYDELPAGVIDETGYEGNLKLIGSVVDCAYRTTIRYSFIATNCRKIKEPDPDENEFIEVIEKPIKQFIEQVRAGKLTDVELAYRALDYLNLFSRKLSE